MQFSSFYSIVPYHRPSERLEQGIDADALKFPARSRAFELIPLDVEKLIDNYKALISWRIAHGGCDAQRIVPLDLAQSQRETLIWMKDALGTPSALWHQYRRTLHQAVSNLLHNTAARKYLRLDRFYAVCLRFVHAFNAAEEATYVLNPRCELDPRARWANLVENLRVYCGSVPALMIFTERLINCRALNDLSPYPIHCYRLAVGYTHFDSFRGSPESAMLHDDSHNSRLRDIRDAGLLTAGLSRTMDPKDILKGISERERFYGRFRTFAEASRDTLFQQALDVHWNEAFHEFGIDYTPRKLNEFLGSEFLSRRGNSRITALTRGIRERTYYGGFIIDSEAINERVLRRAARELRTFARREI